VYFQSNLEHSTVGKKSRFYFRRGLGQDESNGVWHDKVLHQVSCVARSICKAAVGDPGEKESDKNHRVAVIVEEEALSLPDEERTLH